MKRIICLFLLALIAPSIFACTETKEVTRFEEQGKQIGGIGISLSGISNEAILGCYFDLFENDSCGEMYLPLEGSFTTEDGVEFVSVVKERSMSLFESSSKILKLSFTLEIYSKDNQLILSEEITCQELRVGDTIPNPEVSEDMVKYWSAVKAPASDYARSSREVQ